MALEKGKIYKKKKSMKKATTTIHGRIQRIKRKFFGTTKRKKNTRGGSSYISSGAYKRRLDEAGEI